VIPIGDSWPLDGVSLSGDLARIAGRHSTVYVSLAQETRGDPDRQIETWLNTHLYRFDEDWLGTVRLLRFAGGGDTAQTLPVGVRFGEGITLEGLDLLDTAAGPGQVVRIRLHWRALAPVSQQLRTFTHLFDGDTILAQHDGQPVNELRPTTTWKPGETIADQFAIVLPADARPGLYRLRIGLYEINSLARLPAVLADGTVGEFFAGGSIVVK
jgi:hypothetical protein